MGAPATTTTPAETSLERRFMLGADGFYVLVRAFVLGLLCLVAPALSPGADLWPPVAPDQSVVIGVLWAYIAFGVFTLIILFVPFLRSALRLAFLFDIGFITLLAFFSGQPQQIFYPLYLMPLIGAAIQLQPVISLPLGLVTALLYAGAEIGSRYARFSIDPQNLLDLTALGLRMLVLVVVPWLTSGLAERWTADNRASVALAQQQADAALHEAQNIRDQMRSLYEVALNLSTTLNYQSVLDSTLAEARKLVSYSSGLVLLSTGQPDELYVAAIQSNTPGDRGQRVTITSGVLAATLRSADAQISDPLPEQDPLRRVAGMERCQSTMLIPLRAALRTYGVLIIGSERRGSFAPYQLDMLVALSNYAIVALHNAQLIYDLREERNKLLMKEEQVRYQLARDLHDGPAQSLAAITMNVEFLKKLLERDPGRVVDELDKLGAMARRTTHEVRTMLFELRPLVLETQGLVVTLEQYLERFKGSGPQILLESERIDANLDTRVEGTLFNIIQESINNALKHAQARHIWVRLKQSGKTLEATIQDDGRGFDLAKVRQSYETRGSFGLLNIDERARLVGGSAEIHSAPGSGTTVRVLVPIE